MVFPQSAINPQPDAGLVLSKAVVRAAEHLDIAAKTLAAVLGISEATVSRMRRGGFRLEPATKPFELAVLFVRLFRSLDAISGGDETVSRRWLTSQNVVLGGPPAEKIRTVTGLLDVIAYLDARRAIV